MTADTLSGDESLVLPELDRPPADPVELLERWLADARARGVREPLAATLATTDGRTVSSRTILVKGVVDGRVVFGSRTTSRKGQDLAAVPHASLTFYWRETLQQVHVSGPVAQLGEHGSDELFDGRTATRRRSRSRRTRATSCTTRGRCGAPSRGSSARASRSRAPRTGPGTRCSPIASSSGTAGRTGCTGGSSTSPAPTAGQHAGSNPEAVCARAGGCGRDGAGLGG